MAIAALVLLAGHPALRGADIATCDEASLLAAVRAGGSHTLSCSGTITLSAAIPVTNSVQLIATGDVILKPSGVSRVFEVMTNASLTLSNVTVSGGHSTNQGGGAILVARLGQVTLLSCTLSNNVAQGEDGSAGRDGGDGDNNGSDGKSGGGGRRTAGGAVYNMGTFRAVHSMFMGNRAAGGDGGAGGAGGAGGLTGGDGGGGGNGGAASGGAIFNAGRLEIVGCGFYENFVQGGAAAEGGEGGDVGNGRFPGVLGRGGRGGAAAGGAIFSTNKAVAWIAGSTFSVNRAFSGTSAHGGYSGNSGRPGPAGAGAFGGGLASHGTVTVLNSTFHENEIQAGAGGDGDDAELAPGNGGDGGDAWGGNLYNAGTSFVTNCTFFGGVARPGARGFAGQGKFTGEEGDAGHSRGANLGSAKGKFFLSHCIVTNFPATTNQYTATTITNITTTIEINEEETNAVKEVCVEITTTRSDGVVLRDTYECNTTTISSVGVTNGVKVVSSTNVSTVTAVEKSSSAYGAFKDGGYNLVSDRSIKFKKGSTSRVDIDPLLGELQDNGGPTETMELLDDSPAIDGGSEVVILRTDQRGAYRPAGEATDIGAFEYDGDFVEPPSITSQPASLTVDAGATVAFEVGLAGTTPFAYQWFRQPATPIAGATTAKLTISPALPADAGGYFVTASNRMGSVTSVIATLTVRAAAPTVTADVQDQSIYRGENTVFEFKTSGIPTPYVQWFFNETNRLADVTGATLLLTNVQPAQAGTYQAIATNYFGAVTSRVAILTVAEGAPVILAEPADFTGYSGDSHTLSFPTVGGPVPVYQWLFNGTNVLSGASGSTLSLTNLQPSDSGSYQAIATNEYGSVTSRVAVVSVVHSAPVIVQGLPATTNLTAGSTLVLEVQAKGSLPLTYQWIFISVANINTPVPVPGATNATLTLPNFQSANEGSYTVEITNPFGTEIPDPCQVQLPLAARR